MTPRVAITGIGLLTPLSASSEGLFASLCQGESAIRPLNPTPLDGRTCSLAAQLVDLQAEKHLSGRPLRPLDRNGQLAIIACGFALQNSGWCAENRSNVDISLVIGTMFGGMHTIGEFDRSALLSGPASVSPMSFANTVISAATGQTAIWHHLRGVNSTIAAGSISGLSAVSYASDLIRLGQVKLSWRVASTNSPSSPTGVSVVRICFARIMPDASFPSHLTRGETDLPSEKPPLCWPWKICLMPRREEHRCWGKCEAMPLRLILLGVKILLLP